MAKLRCGDPNNPDGPGRKENGEPCNNTCETGLTRCYLHGGRVPAALAKAKVALALLRMPAIEVLHAAINQLHKIIEQFMADTCPTCGYPKGDAEEKKLLVKSCISASRVATAVLDRTDVGPKATLEVKQSDFDIDLAQFDVVETRELEELGARWNALKEAHRRRIHGVAFGVDEPPTVM